MGERGSSGGRRGYSGWLRHLPASMQTGIFHMLVSLPECALRPFPHPTGVVNYQFAPPDNRMDDPEIQAKIQEGECFNEQVLLRAPGYQGRGPQDTLDLEYPKGKVRGYHSVMGGQGCGAGRRAASGLSRGAERSPVGVRRPTARPRPCPSPIPHAHARRLTTCGWP